MSATSLLDRYYAAHPEKVDWKETLEDILKNSSYTSTFNDVGATRSHVTKLVEVLENEGSALDDKVLEKGKARIDLDPRLYDYRAKIDVVEKAVIAYLASRWGGHSIKVDLRVEYPDNGCLHGGLLPNRYYKMYIQLLNRSQDL